MRRPMVTVLALASAAVVACGSSGKGTVASPPVSGGASSSSNAAPSSAGATSAATPAGPPSQGSASAAQPSAAPSSAASPNGEAARSATAVLADARAALAAAHSVHFTGSGSNGGSPLKFDLHLLSSRGAVGTIGIKGTVLQLVRIGTQVYVKGSDAFYQQFAGTGAKGAAIAQLLHGKWLKTTTANSDFADFTDLTDIKALARQLTPSGAIVKGAPATLRGVPTVTLVDSDKSTLAIAATGRPYPLRVSNTGGGSDASVLDFLDYDAPVQLTPPPATDTIDIDALAGSTRHSAAPSAAG